MIWTYTIPQSLPGVPSNPQFIGGQINVWAIFSNDTTLETLARKYPTTDPTFQGGLFPLNVINADLATLNALAATDLTKLPKGAPQPTPAAPIVQPTPDQTSLIAYQQVKGQVITQAPLEMYLAFAGSQGSATLQTLLGTLQSQVAQLAPADVSAAEMAAVQAQTISAQAPSLGGTAQSAG